MTRAVFVAAGVLAAALPATAQRGPAPTPTTLPAEVVSLACAPTLAYEPPAVPLRISGSQDAIVRTSHAPGELLTINEPVASLGDLIDVLERRVPSFTTERDELFNFAVNGELVLHGEKNVALSSGDEIEVVVAFSGG